MSDLIRKKHHYNLLYDYYKELLTEKQRRVFELSYHQDWSLSEIASSLEISRNAVYDMLKTVESALDSLEDKLKNYERHTLINVILNEYEGSVDEKAQEMIKKIREVE